MQEFNTFKSKGLDHIKIEITTDLGQYPIWIHIKQTKISKFSRVFTLFTPFIILNRSGL